MPATPAFRLRTYLWYLPAIVFATIPVVTTGKLYWASTPLKMGQFRRDLAIAGAAAGLIAVGLARCGGRDRTKGSALAFAVLLSGAYPILSDSLGVSPCTWPDTFLGIACVVSIGLILSAIGRSAPDVLDGSVALLWVMVAAFVVYASYKGVVRAVGAQREPDRSALGGPPVKLGTATEPPDIIHILFDGLGRLDVLQSTYGLDSVALHRVLEADGLQINDAAVANYAQTYLAVSSILSMEYPGRGAAAGGGSQRPVRSQRRSSTRRRSSGR